MRPCRAFHELLFLFLLFLAGKNVGSLKTQISQKVRQPEYLRGKKKLYTHVRRRVGGGTLRGRAGLTIILHVFFHLFEKESIFRCCSETISSTIIVACETRLTENGILD